MKKMMLIILALLISIPLTRVIIDYQKAYPSNIHDTRTHKRLMGNMLWHITQRDIFPLRGMTDFEWDYAIFVDNSELYGEDLGILTGFDFSDNDIYPILDNEMRIIFIRENEIYYDFIFDKEVVRINLTIASASDLILYPYGVNLVPRHDSTWDMKEQFKVISRGPNVLVYPIMLSY